MTNVVIGIPTFKRQEGLRQLLRSVAEQDCKDILCVVVADNEGENGVGVNVVNEFIKAGFPFPLKWIPVPDRGISQVRNALMQEAFENLACDNLAMVDDDEHVESNWVSELIKMQQSGNYDVVGGFVLPDFAISPPDWVKDLNLYYRPKLPAGTVKLVNGTTNVLLHRSVRDNFSDNLFDLKFSLTGGGDREFFTRLKHQGAIFGFAPNAVSYEIFNASRLTLEWAKQRAFRIGAGDARIFRRYSSGYAAWIKEIIKLLGAFTVSSVMMIFTFFFPPKKVFYMLKIMRQRGKLNGLFGEPVEVYKQIHGS
jgi:glycosyltransferase involved in cell wall biosynthesis